MAAAGAWALAGVLGGLSVAATAEPATGWLVWLPAAAGLAMGAAIGLSGLAAVGAGLLGYGIAAALAQTLGIVPGGPSVVSVVLVMIHGTGAALGAAVALLLGAGARSLVRERLSVPGGKPPGGAGGEASGGPATPIAASPAGAPTGAPSRASRWAVYWLLATVLFPPIDLVFVEKAASLGPGPVFLLFALLIAGEGVFLGGLVRPQGLVHPQARGLGSAAAAGLVFGTTVVWAFALLIIAILSSTFTF